MTNKQSKKGFTLVELSIVLVIIGLLIGGILVAQSMIGTAKIQALTRQFGQFDAAVSNFTTRYNGLPGDLASIGTAALAGGNGLGDGDGQIEISGGGAADDFSGEIGTFWNALSLTGLSTGGAGLNGNTYVQAVVPVASLAIAGAAANIPKAAGGSASAGILAYGSAAGTNWYSVISTSQFTGSAFIAGTATNGALKPSEALAVDVKIDNGVANSGLVQATTTTIAAGPAGGDAASVTATCSNAATYTIATTTDACNLNVRLGAQTGLTQ